MSRLRLVFMGTPAFAVPTLAALHDAGHDVCAVYTQPPRPAGRGQAERRSAVHDAAVARGLEVLTPARLKPPEVQAAFAAHGADAAVVAAYGLILPAAVLAAPRLGCLNLHASLLPRWRGAAPIQWAILAGDAETGVCAMQMDAGLDTGAVLACERVAIGSDTTAGSLHDALAAVGAPLMLRALAGRADGTLQPVPQPAEGVTYARKLGPADAALDWRDDAAALERRIRAMAPHPGAAFAHGSETIKVLAAEVVAGSGEPGVIVDDAATVACGSGALRLRTVQRAGRRPVDATAFLRGYALPPGTRLPLPAPADVPAAPG